MTKLPKETPLLKKLNEKRIAAAQERRNLLDKLADGDSLSAPDEHRFNDLGKEIDKLGALLKDEIGRLNEEQSYSEAVSDSETRSGVTAYGEARPEARYNTALPKGARIGDLSSRATSVKDTAQYIRSLVNDTSDFRDMQREAERRSSGDAQSEGTPANGGYLVPVEYGAPILDTALADSVLTKAGMQTVPMKSDTLKRAKLLTLPAGGWRAEHAAISVSRATFGEVTFDAKTWAVAVPISRELQRDSGPDADALLVGTITEVVRGVIETAAFFGTGSGNNQPQGIVGTGSVVETHLGAGNGLAATYDDLVNAVGRLQDKGFTNPSVIYSGRTQRGLAKLKEATTNAYLAPPVFLNGFNQYMTNFIPNNLVGQGTSTGNASKIFVGEFDKTALGINTTLEFSRDNTTRMVANGETLLIAWLRLDFQVLRPEAVEYVSSVL